MSLHFHNTNVFSRFFFWHSGKTKQCYLNLLNNLAVHSLVIKNLQGQLTDSKTQLKLDAAIWSALRTICSSEHLLSLSWALLSSQFSGVRGSIILKFLWMYDYILQHIIILHIFYKCLLYSSYLASYLRFIRSEFFDS